MTVQLAKQPASVTETRQDRNRTRARNALVHSQYWVDDSTDILHGSPRCERLVNLSTFYPVETARIVLTNRDCRALCPCALLED